MQLTAKLANNRFVVLPGGNFSQRPEQAVEGGQ